MGIKKETVSQQVSPDIFLTSAMTVILLISGIKMGFYYPANHIEISILKSEKELTDVSPMDLTLIPEKVKYVFIDNSGKILKSNVTDEEEKEKLKSYREDNFPFSECKWRNEKVDVTVLNALSVSDVLICPDTTGLS